MLFQMHFGQLDSFYKFTRPNFVLLRAALDIYTGNILYGLENYLRQAYRI